MFHKIMLLAVTIGT